MMDRGRSDSPRSSAAEHDASSDRRFAVRLLLPAVVPGQRRSSAARRGHRERARVRHVVANVDRSDRLRFPGRTVRGAPGGRAQVPGTKGGT